MWSGLVILVAIGVATAIARVLAVANVALPVTEARLSAARAIFPAYTDEIPQIEKSFSDTTTLTLLHVIPGALFLILGLFQFSPQIRERHIGFHRWSGRVVVFLAVFAGVTGVLMGVVFPYSHTERLPTALAGALLMIAPVMAIRAIRRGDVARHREWMIRLFAVGVGIVAIRLVGPVIIMLMSPTPFRDIVGLTFWAGWILSVFVAELWIRLIEAPITLTEVTLSE